MSETFDKEMRRMMFVKGFGAGAKMNSIQYPASMDYMAGWDAGTEALREAVKTYCDANDLPRANILRAEVPAAPIPLEQSMVYVTPRDVPGEPFAQKNRGAVGSELRGAVELFAALGVPKEFVEAGDKARKTISPHNIKPEDWPK